IGEQIADFLRKTVEFVRGGLGLADVLPFDAVDLPRFVLEVDRDTTAPPTRETLPPGDGFDVYLEHPGYNTVRMRQMLGVLLSIDVIQATRLIDAAPTVLLTNVSRARADEIVALVKRTGGKGVVSPAGVLPPMQGPER